MDENPYQAPDWNAAAGGERIAPPRPGRRSVGCVSALFVVAAIYLVVLTQTTLTAEELRGRKQPIWIYWLAAAICLVGAYFFQRRPPATES